MSGDPIPPTPARRPVPPRSPPPPKPQAGAAAPAGRAGASPTPVRSAADKPADASTPPASKPVSASKPPPKSEFLPGASSAPLTSPSPEPAPVGGIEMELVAKPATYYRGTRYLMVALLIGMGLWFSYDGWKGYPAENATVADLDHKLELTQKRINLAKGMANMAEAAQLQEQWAKSNLERSAHKPHQAMDILFQKLCGIGLPILGILTLLWALYNSRGVYRLAQRTLSVPGHPPVPLDKVLTVDKNLWDRKGIAYVDYEINGVRGRLRLDDYIYDRDATDAIFKKIEESLVIPE